MRHLSAWRAVGLVAVALVGCGPGKELPEAEDVPKPSAPAGPPPDPNGPAPAASDPEAKAVLERAVKAVTGNVPGGLAKAKVSRVVYDGQVRPKDEPLAATRDIRAVWPDRAHAVQDLDGLKLRFRLRNRQGWFTQGLVTQNFSPADAGRTLRADFHAQHWLPLGLTLADPKAVAFGKTATAGGTAVKVALADQPDLPVFLVTFADPSGVPVKVEYHPVEQGQRVHKVYAMSGHRPFAGFDLPARTEFSQNGRTGETWTTKEWEFPDKLDEALFDPPKE